MSEKPAWWYSTHERGRTCSCKRDVNKASSRFRPRVYTAATAAVANPHVATAAPTHDQTDGVDALVLAVVNCILFIATKYFSSSG